MRKYIITTFFIILIVTTSILYIQSQIDTKNNINNIANINNQNVNKNIYITTSNNQDVLRVQQITGWPTEISTYFVEEANTRGVLIFEEALPIASIETGGTYHFNSTHHNTNGSTDQGLFQINDVTYLGIVKQLKMEGRQFDSWDRTNPEFNISAGMFWIGYLKNEYQLEKEALFTSYNRGVQGGKKYASRYGSYESDYSKKVKAIKNSY